VLLSRSLASESVRKLKRCGCNS